MELFCMAEPAAAVVTPAIVDPAAVTPAAVVTPPAPVLNGEPIVDKIETEAPAKTAEELAAEEAAKTPEQKAADAAAKAEADKAKGGAPETYEPFVLPDGVESDAEALEAFLPVAKEWNLTQAQAQKLVDLQAAHAVKGAEAVQKNWTDTNAKWVADAKTDKEIGGDKFDENVGYANSVIRKFGTPELTAALHMTGAGNHPEFIRLMTRVGRAMGEDGIVAGNPAGAKKSAEDRIYNHPTS
jgi:hypothetical protein